MKPKIYGFQNYAGISWIEAVALAEDGYVLASRTSADEQHARVRLGMNGEPALYVWEYYDHCPGGFEVEFVPSDQIAGHEGLQAALQRAREIYRDENREAE